MRRHAFVILGVWLSLLLAACGGGGGGSSGGGGGGGGQQAIPALSAISPRTTTAGVTGVTLTLIGSNFQNGASAEWNDVALATVWVSSTQMTATIPASDLNAAGTVNVTVVNPGGGASTAQPFTILAAPVASTWVKPVAGMATPQDIAWDSAHGKLYISMAATDPVSPNTIIAWNPLTAVAATPVPAGSNPDLLTISSDSSYLWVGLDGDNSVQRFLLPGLTKDISFPVPLSGSNSGQQAVSLEAAPVSPHTVALVAGSWNLDPPGNGVYVYDDATQRPTFVPGYQSTGTMLDWIQWGADDSVIYGNQYTTIDRGGIATLSVTPAGVSLVSYNGGQVNPNITTYNKATGLLYSYGGAYNPVDGSLVGEFDYPSSGSQACTADSGLGRYYCVEAYNVGGTDVSEYDLWVFDLNTYDFINRIEFGFTAGQLVSPITGQPTHLVRWGNAGLAVATITAPYLGQGGVFLIDGAAINPGAAPDFSSGVGAPAFSWMTSLTPVQALAGNQDVTITVNGNNFTPNSTVCWNCNFLQPRPLATSYVSPQELKTTIPASMMATPGSLLLSVFDSSTNLFSTDNLTFTIVAPQTGSTQVTAMDICGLDMEWDPNSVLLYVGVANNDGQYPNSIVAVNGETATVVKSQPVGPDPYLVSVSASGQYLYVGYANATTMTQLQLPGLNSPLTWGLNNPQSSAVYTAGDLRAAPVDAHTTAVVLLNLDSSPDETGGVVVYDDNVERPNYVGGFGPSQNIYDYIAWTSSDQILTAVCAGGCLTNTPLSPLYVFQVSPTGAIYDTAGQPNFGEGDIHSDFGTGLIYSDDGNVADPSTQQVVGTYNAAGLLAADSTLNRVFILGQTQWQVGTNNYTIDSFDEKAYVPISSIAISNLQGTPMELVRWGSSGLAVLTFTGDVTQPALLYLIQDTNFVSNMQNAAVSKPQELVKRRWKRISKRDMLEFLRTQRYAN